MGIEKFNNDKLLHRINDCSNQIKIREQENVMKKLSLVLLFSLASFGLIQKYLGYSGCFVYFLSIYALQHLLHRHQPKVVTNYSKYLILILLLLLTCAFVIFKILFPQWELRVDRNEALDIAVRHLINGEYIYNSKTQLNNPISPLPGAVFLSVPFVLLGSSSYQNFFWLFVLIYLLWKMESQTYKLLCFLISMCTCLAFSQEWLFGGDLISNNFYILIAVLGIIAVWKENDSSTELTTLSTKKYSLAVFFGVTLSSRPNYVFWFVLVYLFMLRRYQLKRVLPFAIVTIMTVTLVTLPFWLYNPTKFSPLHTANKIGGFDGLWIYIILFTSIICSLFAALYANNWNQLIKWGALIQIIPILFLICISSIKNGHLDFSPTKERYGLNYIVPGLITYFYTITSGRCLNLNPTIIVDMAES
jgi:hypothetical protein